LVPLLAICVLLGCDRERGELVISGRVENRQIEVGSKLGGRVESVHAQEGERVTSGTILVRLDDGELLAELAARTAAVAQAEAQLDLLLAGTRAEELARARATVDAARAELELREAGF